MKPSEPNRFDLIPAILIVLLGVSALVFGGRLLAGSGDTLMAEISLNGAVTDTYMLPSLPEEGITLTLNGNGETLTVLLDKTGATVLDSTCAGHDCVKTGKITRAGRSIVCLPSRIVITLKGADNGIDIYAG